MLASNNNYLETPMLRAFEIDRNNLKANRNKPSEPRYLQASRRKIDFDLEAPPAQPHFAAAPAQQPEGQDAGLGARFNQLRLGQ